MFRLLSTLTLSAAALVLAGAAASQTAPPADDSLYRAWGGKEGIHAVMRDFVPRLEAHPRIGRFFRREGRDHLVAMLTEQLCHEAGGPCRYEGAPMATVHRDLDIGRADFNALVEVLQLSMDARGIPFKAQNAMLARLAPMHRDIVTR